MALPVCNRCGRTCTYGEVETRLYDVERDEDTILCPTCAVKLFMIVHGFVGDTNKT